MTYRTYLISLKHSNGSVRVDYEVMFNSTSADITADSLTKELQEVVRRANGTIGNSLKLGQLDGGRLFNIEGT